jgi:hypothetical protein
MTASTPLDGDWSMITFTLRSKSSGLEAIPRNGLMGAVVEVHGRGVVGRQRPVLSINAEAFQEGTVGWA